MLQSCLFLQIPDTITFESGDPAAAGRGGASDGGGERDYFREQTGVRPKVEDEMYESLWKGPGRGGTTCITKC